MNPLKKGPEIKLPPLKAPAFLVDLYYDLHDRHLLPLAALLVVALIATPFLLGGSSDSESETPASEGPTATASASGFNASDALVVQATPGLRDYRRRLDDLESKNPFDQRYAAEEPGSEGGTGESTESSGSVEFSESGGSSEVPSFSEGDDSTSTPGKLTYFSYAIDVRVVPGGSQDGGDSRGEPTVRKNLPELTMLPSRETPAVIYMGSTRDGKKALMLISSDVEAIFGDAKCVLGSQTCELLALEVGTPETFVYGGAGKTYTIELLKIRLLETDKLNKAPLGKPKKGKGGNRPALRAVAQPR